MHLSRDALRCLRLIEAYARKSGRAFPFQRTLAAQLGCTERTVQRFYHTLQAAGLIKIQRRGPHSAVVTVGSFVGSFTKNVGSFESYPYSEVKSFIEEEKKRPQSETKTETQRHERIQELLTRHGNNIRKVELIIEQEGWYS